MATAAVASSRLQNLLCRSTSALFNSLPKNNRLAALDISKSHISIAISDRELESAAPFGVLARLSPKVDSNILHSAFNKVEEPLDVGGLIVGVSPEGRAETELIDALVEREVFGGLCGVLFYSEAHALRRAIDEQLDFVNAMKRIPEQLETRKQKRFAAAMNPKVSKEELMMNYASRAQISASDILRAVLLDFKEEDCSN